jgi:hypothetical protein
VRAEGPRWVGIDGEGSAWRCWSGSTTRGWDRRVGSDEGSAWRWWPRPARARSARGLRPRKGSGVEREVERGVEEGANTWPSRSLAGRRGVKRGCGLAGAVSVLVSPVFLLVVLSWLAVFILVSLWRVL